MKKLIVVIVCAVFMFLTTGCGELFNAIEKDTVIVKKITKEHKRNEVKYEGVLSQDAVKTLSLNAVNKYFNKKLTMDMAQFEVIAIDQKKLKDLLDKVEYDVDPRPKHNQVFKFDTKTELYKYPNGLFYMTLIPSADRNEVYDIVLNAKDGDVIKISKANQIPEVVYNDKRPEVIMDEVIGIANQFIQEKGSYLLTDLILNEEDIRWGIISEMYYMSKDNQSLSYSIMINSQTKEVVGFNKEVMAMLSYYSGS
ncbi:hypothetical protein NV379_09680 [Paenibacillus sp. N1-5-1-14]|uniref:hypothetical protein n=1 Tax=Paenibacillus radicibacter TaxID=2972488 RepID=UPI002158A324|nr:hypothetical protein [Paenibacillus radicibacter]MCR8642931.1 hypothetical protein [Paenibacillus radicibacter]